MPLQTGTRTTFNSTVGLKIDLSDAAPFIVDPDDVPLTTRLKKKGPTLNAVKHEWQEDSLIPTTDLLNGAIGDTTTTTFTVDNGDRFKPGYVVAVEGEQVRVNAVNGNALTVTRGYAGSTAETLSDNAVMSIVGYAVTDGADPAQFSTTNRVLKYNYHQVFQEAVTVSMLEEWAENYGVGDKYSYEVMKQLKKLAIIKEKALFHGKRSEDTTNGTRTMGGLDYYITSVIDSSGTFDITKINAMLKTLYNNGGSPKLIVLSPKQKLVLDYLITSSQLQYARPSTSEKLGQAVSQFQSSFGTLDILMDRWCPDSTMYILDTSTISIINGRPFTLETLAKTGTATKGEIVGFGSFEVKSESWSGKFTGLS
jgi:hypothetical protein